ncbi:MAG: phage tail protein [Sphingobacteriales bacterium]|nr:MAG: phage tail protein [Sphingobacteriales bacterium]
MDGVIGYITLFAGNFAPAGWQLCYGQSLNINEYQALFSIISFTYGGDNRTSFNLPDLRGRSIIGPGQGPGLSNYVLAKKGGYEAVTLTPQMIPHKHPVSLNVGLPCNDSISNSDTPAGTIYGFDTYGNPSFSQSPSGLMAPSLLGMTTDIAGNNNPVPMNTRSACLALNYIICCYGEYPPPAPDNAQSDNL